MPVDKINFKGLVLLWAFAESGIGGVLHALKLPFTGIFVGGIAVMCIALMGYYNNGKKNQILEALVIVLLVKLAVSPHSPWQAYVAVVFQGYLGYFIFNRNSNYKVKTLVYAVLCLLESALQKIILAVVIYGTNFLSAIDQAAMSIIKSLGINLQGSLVMAVFAAYFLLHLITAIILGLWIPHIPAQLAEVSKIIPLKEANDAEPDSLKNQKRKSVIYLLIIPAVLLLLIKLILPEMKSIDLILIFLRSVAVSLLLIFIAGPLVIKLIKSISERKNYDKAVFEDVIDSIPAFTSSAYHILKWVNLHYSGVRKVRYFLLGLLAISSDMNHKNE